MTDCASILKQRKVILIGSTGVGKTTLIVKLATDSYEDENQATIGVQFFKFDTENSSGEKIELQIWDTAGQENSRAIVLQYFRDTNVALVCFDFLDQVSKDSIDYWANAVSTQEPDCHLFLVATKSDTYKDFDGVLRFMNEKCEQNPNFKKSFITSAKNGENVMELFREIADEEIYEKFERSQTVKIGGNDPRQQQQKKNDCC